MKRTHTTRTAAVVVAILFLAGPVTSAGAKTHKYTASLTSAQMSTANGFPAQGGTASFAGALKTNVLGAGALVDHLTIIGNSQPNVIVFKGTEVAFFPNGTLRSTLVGTNTIAGDGSQRVGVKGEVTGGTGRYRNATGRYQFTGNSAPGSTILRGTSHGKVSY